MTEYSQFAHVYDVFMEDAPYDQWVSFTKDICDKYDSSPKKVIDLGCGTGEISLRLANKGYVVTGVDLSQDMLTIADQKSQEQGLEVTWIKQDLRTLEGISGFDLAVSYCDVINYIPELEDLRNTFENIYHSLKEDGLLIFDVHDVEYVKNDLIEHTFSDVNDEMAYIWNCFGSEHPGEMFHELTFFLKQGDHYIRFDEDHHQRTYKPSVFRNILEEIGFVNINIYHDFNCRNEKQETFSERNFIVAQKQSR